MKNVPKMSEAATPGPPVQKQQNKEKKREDC